MACALLCSVAYAQAQTKTKDLSKPQTQVKGYYTVLWQSTRAHQEGATVGRVGRMAQWFRSGQATQQREPRRLLSAISKEPCTMESPLRVSESYRPARHQQGQAQNTRHTVGGKCRGFAERSTGKTKERESQPSHRFPVCGKGNGAFRHHRPLHQYAQQQVPSRRDTL